MTMDRLEFCKKVKAWMADEEKTHWEYLRFARVVLQDQLGDITAASAVVEAANQENTHEKMFEELYRKYCT